MESPPKKPTWLEETEKQRNKVHQKLEDKHLSLIKSIDLFQHQNDYIEWKKEVYRNNRKKPFFEEQLPVLAEIMQLNKDVEKVEYDHFLNSEHIDKFNEQNKKLIIDISKLTKKRKELTGSKIKM